MKVLAINSSRRKGNTFHLLLQLQDMLEKEGIQVKIINLYDYHIKHCIGCENCLIRGNCNIEDDLHLLVDEIKEYDGIILSSPVYLRSVSGILKTFVDRTCSWYHRPVLYGKPLLAVATTKGSGLKYTLKYLEDIGIQWGMLPTNMIGRSIVNINKPITYKECKKFIRNLKTDKQKHRPPLKSITNYSVQKALANHLHGLDSEYWEYMNWNNQDYFYACKIGIIKRLIGKSIFRFLNTIMKTSKNTMS